MATRAEAAKAESQRKGRRVARGPRTSGAAKTVESPGTSREGTGRERRASVAREQRSPTGRTSRKSTRGSENRVKATAPLEIREELQKTTPSTRFRRARAQSTRVRGHDRG